MSRHHIAARLAEAFREVWVDRRRRTTLARIAFHRRQFENWWKFEIGTHLWQLAKELDASVWLEADGRADIVIAPAVESASPRIDLSGGLRLRIELKTVGTFWKDHKKAYADASKKGLLSDMRAAVRRRDTARPFACVALLVTHHGGYGELAAGAFLAFPRELADKNDLIPILDEEVPLGCASAGIVTSAHQFLWATKSA